MEENKAKKSSSSKTKKKNKTFEDSMSELEEIVKTERRFTSEESIEYFREV